MDQSIVLYVWSMDQSIVLYIWSMDQSIVLYVWSMDQSIVLYIWSMDQSIVLYVWSMDQSIVLYIWSMDQSIVLYVWSMDLHCGLVRQISQYYENFRTQYQYIQSSRNIDGLVQGCSNPIINALELPQSCAKPSTSSRGQLLR